MSIERSEQEQRGKKRRTWTDRISSDLLDFKKKALELVNSEDPPRLENGKKKVISF